MGHSLLYVTFVCLSIFRGPYLTNHLSCDHHFWYTWTNDDISRVFFIFFNINFSSCQGCKKPKNGSKWPKNNVHLTPYPQIFVHMCKIYVRIFLLACNTISLLRYEQVCLVQRDKLIVTCVKWWYLQQFFSFFQNSDFSDFKKISWEVPKILMLVGVAYGKMKNFIT